VATSVRSSSLVLESRLDAIDDARRWVRACADEAAIGDHEAALRSDVVSAIELALTEVLSNVIRHAYDGRPDHEIDLVVQIDRFAIRLEVCDDGRPFDADAYRPPDLANPGRGGYGVMLIESLMDEVVRERLGDRGTRLSLVKRFESGAFHG
jgi:anti-sigma regulatory factor (Ser/Thr protein kinase)